jgi:hypothetical protein
MPRNPKGIRFSANEVELIYNSLPSSSKTKGIEALNFVLHYWACNDLREHLSRPALASDWKQSTRDLKIVEKLGQELFKVIEKLGCYSRTRMVLVVASGNPQRIAAVDRDKHLQAEQYIANGLTFLRTMSRLTTTDKRGRPRNLVAYLVIRDAAAIYEWYTGKKPSRVVDRVTHKEAGRFWTFLETLWPIIFEKGTDGLRAAMQRWYEARNLNEKSPIFPNIRLRYGRKNGS